MGQSPSEVLFYFFDWVTVVWSDESHFKMGFSTRNHPQKIQVEKKLSKSGPIITRPTVPDNCEKWVSGVLCLEQVPAISTVYYQRPP